MIPPDPQAIHPTRALQTLVACLLVTGLVLPLAAIGDGIDRTTGAYAVERHERVSLDEAVRRVRERTGGRIVRAETRSTGGRLIHYVRILTPGGRVRTLRVDAETGELL